jgi:DNA-3-methyladenine glycosylase
VVSGAVKKLVSNRPSIRTKSPWAQFPSRISARGNAFSSSTFAYECPIHLTQISSQSRHLESTFATKLRPGGLSLNFSEFFWRSPVAVAPELLGWTLSHAGVVLTIVETEAYLGTEDAASHARSGPTPRSRSMFGPVFHAYLYRSYGIHLCFNVVCHLPEAGGAVLVRAGTVTEGRDLAEERRGSSKGLANGPGKLAQCLALTQDLDGACLATGPLRLQRSESLQVHRVIKRGRRVGISQNQSPLYRFWLPESPDVSKPRAEGELL